jgi:hypothetical protein
LILKPMPDLAPHDLGCFGAASEMVFRLSSRRDLPRVPLSKPFVPAGPNAYGDKARASDRFNPVFVGTAGLAGRRGAARGAESRTVKYAPSGPRAVRAASHLLSILLLATGLAGCMGGGTPPPDGPPAGPYVFPDPLTRADGHDHTDRAHHPEGYNVTLLGHHALVDAEGETAQVHSIDLCDRWVVLGRQRAGEYGVDIVDVSDPRSPQWVGRYRDAEAIPGDRDVAWSADCQFVFMANGAGQVRPGGVRVINARDKANPTLESFAPVPGTPTAGAPLVGGVGVITSVHTVYALRTGGEQYVYALNWGVHIFRLVAGADGKMILQPAGRYATADAEQLAAVNEGGADLTGTRRALYGHDVTVYRDGDRVLMYVAYAYDGLRIVDITNPAAPLELGHWVPPGPGAPHYVHSVKSYRRADGVRITILGAETFEERNHGVPSPLWVLDTTDPARIRHLSTWANPGAHGAGALLFSLHFYEVEREVLWLTHYHGGVWVLGLSDPAAPEVLGYYLPQVDTGFTPAAECCFGWQWGGVPMSFDLKLRDGVAYVADFNTGLYVLTRQALHHAA